MAGGPVVLSLAARTARRQKRGRRRPPQAFPRIVERQYLADLRQEVLRPAWDLVEKHVFPAIGPALREAHPFRADAWDDNLARTFDHVRLEYGRRLTDQELRVLARRQVGRTAEAGRRQQARHLRAVMGIEVLLEPDMDNLARAFVANNARLIRSIPERFLGEVEQLVIGGAQRGRRAGEIEEDLAARFGVSEARAELIAVDQTLKLNGDITRARHEALGIERYWWRTANDDRVRPRHAELEGGLFRYDRPPVVDPKNERRENPGGDYRCRCVADPFIPGFDEEP